MRGPAGVIALALLALTAATTADHAYGDQPEASLFDGDPATTARIDTFDLTDAAVEISQARFARGEAQLAVLSRDDEFADSLAGSALTGEGPLLFTDSRELTGLTRVELDRALPQGARVFLLGGEQAISAGVAATLAEDGYEVERLAGPTRVETAIAVADALAQQQGRFEQVLLARADAPADNSTAA